MQTKPEMIPEKQLAKIQNMLTLCSIHRSKKKDTRNIVCENPKWAFLYAKHGQRTQK